jgi:hypothetical protein
VKIEDIKPGDILCSLVDTGATGELGATTIYYRVLKVNRITVTVRSEYGREFRAYPAIFHGRATDTDWITWH